jgi:hypothetical protein
VQELEEGWRGVDGETFGKRFIFLKYNKMGLKVGP